MSCGTTPRSAGRSCVGRVPRGRVGVARRAERRRVRGRRRGRRRPRPVRAHGAERVRGAVRRGRRRSLPPRADPARRPPRPRPRVPRRRGRARRRREPIVVYVLAVLAAVPLAAHRPCHLALAPLLARTPRELAASNVAALTFESPPCCSARGRGAAPRGLGPRGGLRCVRRRSRSSRSSRSRACGPRSFEARRSASAWSTSSGRARARSPGIRRAPRVGALRRAGVRPRRPRRPARRARDRRPRESASRVSASSPRRSASGASSARRGNLARRPRAARPPLRALARRLGAAAGRPRALARALGRRRVPGALGAREQPARRLGVHDHAGERATGGARAHLRPVRARRHRDGRDRLPPRTGRDRRCSARAARSSPRAPSSPCSRRWQLDRCGGSTTPRRSASRSSSCSSGRRSSPRCRTQPCVGSRPRWASVAARPAR